MTRWLVVVCVCWGIAAPALAEDARSVQFNALLKEAEMRFQPPADAQNLAPSANPVMDYERAVRTADNLMEIRYAIRPVKRLRTR